MSDIERWDPSDINNQDPIPDGAPDNWAGEEVNEWGREVMAAVRRWYEEPEFVELIFQLSPRGAKTLTKVGPGDVTLDVVGVDVRSIFTVGRRIRVTGSGLDPVTQGIESVVETVQLNGSDTRITVTSGTIPTTPVRLEASINRRDRVGVLENAEVLAGRDTGGALQNLVQVNASDEAEIGDADLPLRLAGGELRIASYNAGFLNDGADERALIVPPGYIDGFITSRAAATTISVGPGAAAEEGGTRAILSAGALTLNVNATGAGGLETAKSNDAWYHLWAILDPATGAVDVFGNQSSVSGLSPTLPSPYTLKRRIGSFYIDASGNVLEYTQVGDRFMWSSPPLDVDDINAGTAAVLAPLQVPPDLIVTAIFNAMYETQTSREGAYFTSPYQDDEVGNRSQTTNAFTGPAHSLFSGDGGGAIPFFGQAAEFRIDTDTNRQIRYRQTSSVNFRAVRISTMGWIDPRGRTWT